MEFFLFGFSLASFHGKYSGFAGIDVIVKSNGDEAWQKVKCPTSITKKKEKKRKVMDVFDATLTTILWATLTLRTDNTSESMPALSCVLKSVRSTGMEKYTPGGLL